MKPTTGRNIELKDKHGKNIYENNKVKIISTMKNWDGSEIIHMEGRIKYKAQSTGSLGAGYGIEEENGAFTYLSNICNAEIELVGDENV